MLSKVGFFILQSLIFHFSDIKRFLQEAVQNKDKILNKGTPLREQCRFVHLASMLVFKAEQKMKKEQLSFDINSEAKEGFITAFGEIAGMSFKYVIIIHR